MDHRFLFKTKSIKIYLYWLTVGKGAVTDWLSNLKELKFFTVYNLKFWKLLIYVA